ncbi:unnamed protein product [Brassicogethes aeneus]|uniref:Farnesoic acid O-methyl transferase domain-containing protein n=1 Tax=Brassicogethes aeneus TaxID=1431903 RepID=A0A9P0BBG7_BRAAE|nr:unnamed protein product [Brassicogethes aeneus]
MKCLIPSFLLFCIHVCFTCAKCDDCDNVVLFTPKDNNFNYSFIGIEANKFSFEVEATNDIHIGLFSTPSTDPPWYEFVIGGWGNAKSVIRKDKVLYPYLMDNDVVTSLTPGIVQTKIPNKMWVRFNKHTISAGFQGEDALISFRDVKPIPKITYVGFHVGFGSNGKWKINIPRVRDERR